jgi:hypothetical protein
MDWDPEHQANTSDLERWLSALLDGVAVTMGPLQGAGAAPRAPRGINLYLLSVSPDPRAARERNTQGRGIEFRLGLRFLATAWADSEGSAAELLCKLAFRLLEMDAPESGTSKLVEVESEPLPLELWPALGVPIRPSLVLSLPLAWTKRRELAPRVISLPRLKTELHSTFVGSVVGPDASPVAGALVEWPSLSLVSETNAAGLFTFGPVPAEFGEAELRVRARGVDQSFQVSRTNRGGAVTLQLSLMEEA